jgi:hypothetical protein
MVIEVSIDIRPFCVLVLVIWLGFAFTMRILLYASRSRFILMISARLTDLGEAY